MKFILEALKSTSEYKELSSAFKNGKTPAILNGVTGIHKCAVIYSLFKETGKKILLLSSEESESSRFMEDLGAMGLRCVQYPARDFNYRDTAGSSHEYERQRLDVLNKLKAGEVDCVLASVDAALQYTIPEADLEKRCVKLFGGQEIKIEEVLRYLVLCGYQRDDQIDGTGQFSHRGGIVDFFPPGSDYPVRIEFWGDEIDTISYFDPETQRRTTSVDEVAISPSVEVLPENPKLLAKRIRDHAALLRGKNAPKAREIMNSEADKVAAGIHIGSMDKYISFVYDKPATLLDYFSADNSMMVVSEGSNQREKMRTTLWQWGEDVKDYLSEGILCKGLDMFTADWAYLLSKAEEIPSLHADTFARGSYEIPTRTLINMTVKQLSVWGGSTQLLIEDLQSVLYRKHRCVVLAGTDRTAQTLAEDLKKAGIPAGYFDSVTKVNKGTVAVTKGTLSAGFEIPGAEFTVLTHGRINEVSRKSERKRTVTAKRFTALPNLPLAIMLFTVPTV